jgi:DNA polymerase-3 subunit delta
MQPWQLEKARRELSGWEEGQLIKLVQLAAQTDADVKGASRDPGFSIEKLLFAMARKLKNRAEARSLQKLFRELKPSC